MPLEVDLLPGLDMDGVASRLQRPDGWEGPSHRLPFQEDAPGVGTVFKEVEELRQGIAPILVELPACGRPQFVQWAPGRFVDITSHRFCETVDDPVEVDPLPCGWVMVWCPVLVDPVLVDPVLVLAPPLVEDNEVLPVLVEVDPVVVALDVEFGPGPALPVVVADEVEALEVDPDALDGMTVPLCCACCAW